MTNTSETKAKGPIRTGAVVPSLILITLVWAYFFFFFDSHLRRGIEIVASRVHGAEVNLGSLRTSFFGASVRVGGLEVTNKEAPTLNLVEIGSMHFAMSWDALLRAKAVVEDASVLDIRAGTKRKSPGFVLPPPPPSEGGLLARVQDQVLAQTKQKLNQNFLGDVATVLGGVDPKEQLKNIQGELKANARAMQLEKELAEKKAAWEKRIKDLPKPQEIKALEARIKGLNLNSKNPAELLKNAKQVKEILAEAQAKVKQVDSTQKDLSADITNYTNAVADLERLAAQDVADLQKRLSIPSIDPKEFSTQLFLGQIEKHLVSLRKYVALARKYMPPKKTNEQKAAEAKEALVPRKRGEGVTYKFPITTGYPLFWLKKAAISSEISQSEWAGKVSGQLTHVSTEPSLVGKPMQLQVAGDFPKRGIAGVDLLVSVDHTTERAKEMIRMKVASFPVPPLAFSESADVRFGLKEAVGSSSFLAQLADEALTVGIQGTFLKPQFDLAAKSKPMQEILGAVLAGIPSVTMSASVTGSWDKFAIDIDSNLGRELSAGFQKQLQAKVGEAKGKLDAFVKDKIEPQRAKVKKMLEGLTGGPGKAIADRKGEMDGAMKQAENSGTAGSGPGGKAGGFLKKLF